MKGFQIGPESLELVGSIIEQSLEEFGFLRFSLKQNDGRHFLWNTLYPRLHEEFPQVFPIDSTDKEYDLWTKKAVSTLATRHKSKLLRRHQQRTLQLCVVEKCNEQRNISQRRSDSSDSKSNTPCATLEDSPILPLSTISIEGSLSRSFTSMVIYVVRQRRGMPIGRPAIGLPTKFCTTKNSSCSIQPENVRWNLFIEWVKWKLDFDVTKEELFYEADDRKIFVEDNSELHAAFYDMYNLGRRRFEFGIESGKSKAYFTNALLDAKTVRYRAFNT